MRLVELMNSCTTVIGLHPDEATESIVDFAMEKNLNVAVVPCCVFSRLFPRKDRQGRPVTTYIEFLRYLLEKFPALQACRLPFGSENTKNICLYARGARKVSYIRT